MIFRFTASLLFMSRKISLIRTCREPGVLKPFWPSGWGLFTRSLGALITGTYGDHAGRPCRPCATVSSRRWGEERRPRRANATIRRGADPDGRHRCPGAFFQPERPGGFHLVDPFGGVTTIVDMSYDEGHMVNSAAAVEKKTAPAGKQARIDFALYSTIDPEERSSRIAGQGKAGVTAFKFSTFGTHPMRFPRIHYLTLDEENNVRRLGGKAKINPPIRPRAEVEKLWRHVAAGNVTLVFTDHVSWSEDCKTNPDMLVNASGAPGLKAMMPLFVKGTLERGGSLAWVARLMAQIRQGIFASTT